jgi:hypothetical protein
VENPGKGTCQGNLYLGKIRENANKEKAKNNGDDQQERKETKRKDGRKVDNGKRPTKKRRSKHGRKQT